MCGLLLSGTSQSEGEMALIFDYGEAKGRMCKALIL